MLVVKWVLLCLALGLCATVKYVESTPGVSAANVRRIRIGMKIEEVRVLFGRPEDDFESGDGGSWSTWVGKAGVLDVTCDEEGKVDSLRFSPSSLFERLRAGIGW